MADKAWLARVTGQQPSEDDMPYTPEQLTAFSADGVTQASVFLARNPEDGGIYIFCRLPMTRRHLLTEEDVTMARTQLGIPWLRGDAEPNQDVAPSLVALFTINDDEAAETVKLDPQETAALVASIATAVADEEAKRLAN